MNAPLLHAIAAASLVGMPLVVAAGFAIAMWSRLSVTDATERVVSLSMSVGFLVPAVGALTSACTRADGVYRISYGTWFGVEHYDYALTMLVDPVSLLLSLSFGVLTGLVGLFSRRYLHRETGYFRFYFLLAMFGAGVEIVVLAGGLDLVFVGWEIVGVTSALLIGFFHDRPKPAEHGLRAFVTYRLCDVGLLTAAVWMHHLVGTTDFLREGTEGLAYLSTPSSQTGATLVGLLLVLASLGKSAQVPLGGWLPRAMEGPTPSSAIFYGAISVHLGPYLLLRGLPLIEHSTVVRATVLAIGAATALHATFVGRVQSDIKSALAYASMAQVGVMFVEIGLGLHVVAVVHMVGHGFLRSIQILRSPSLLHDHQRLEGAMGTVLPLTGAHLERWVPKALQPWLYRHALERGYFDALLTDWVVGFYVRTMRAIDGVDARWTRWLAGESSGKDR